MVLALDSAQYDCLAWDWGGGPIVYSWYATRGRLAWDSLFRVKWYAPESSGYALLRCTVTDQEGLKTSDSIVIRVSRRTTVLMDYWGAVKAGTFRVWHESLSAGYEVEAFFAVDTPAVSVLVFDQANYGYWLQRQPCETLVSRIRVREDSLRFSLRTSDVYAFVLENSDERRDKDLHFVLKKRTP